jgi:hypothetical protein
VSVRLAALLTLLAIGACAQPSKPAEIRTIRVPRVNRPPQIDDFLTSAPREAEAVITGFLQREPYDGKPASQPTTVYLSYDDRQFYAIFVCKDEPGKVRAHMTKREDIASDDRVILYLDTFHDRQRAYSFISNPLGIQSDAVNVDGQKADTRFDTLWYSEGRLTEDGYIVSIAVPFKSIRFSRETEQTWGIGLARAFVRRNEISFWPYVTRKRPGLVRQLGTLQGLDSLSPSHNLQFIPYVTATQEHLLDTDQPSYRRKRDLRAGMDSKIVLRDAATLDLALNPDFSQVESDDPQVTINQRYEVFFPEKRPFFIENANNFTTPINLFFSRRIADPEFGARLTGKLGRWAYGTLLADDRAPGRRVAPTNSLFGHRALDGVLRIQREFGEQSNFGLLTTATQWGASWNRLAAFDTRLKLSPTWYFSGQAVRSYNRDTKARHLQGSAYVAEISRTGRHLSYVGKYSDLSPDFRAPLGFIRRVDVRQVSQYAGYFWQPEGTGILNLGPSISAYANWDRKGKLQDWGANVDFVIDFAGPFGLVVGRSETYERYLDRGMRYGKSAINFYVDTLKWLSLYGSFSHGSSVNYSAPWEIGPFVGNSSDLSAGFALRPMSRIRVENLYYYDRLSAGRRAVGDLARPGAVYNSHVYRAKLNYQFTRALSLRGILDYYAILPNPSLIYQDMLKTLSADVLLTYMINPGTAFYIGYNNRYENLAYDSSLGALTRRGIPPNMLTGRQFFVKLNYLLRF